VSVIPIPIPGPPHKARILGLDPGSVRTGWGIVQCAGNRVEHVAAGVLRLPEKEPLEERLLRIHAGLVEVIAQHAPTTAAVEDIFFARFPQAALVLGHARGVALLAIRQAGLAIAAYPPSVVKRALVGSGRADKEQVAMLVGAILGLRTLPPVDATDALAIAITHANASRVSLPR
jgi:crossover junction endodeoxyribonuclease RuvC